MCVLYLVAMVGLSQPAAGGSPASAAKQSKAPTEPRTPADAQIERTLKNKLTKSKMNSDHFTVSVVKGVATIEGSTNVMQHKGAMTRMAKSSGATSVRNNIRISDAAKSKAAASLAKGRASRPAASELVSSKPASSKPASSKPTSELTSRPVPQAASRAAIPAGSGMTAVAPITPIPRATVLQSVTK